MFPQGFTVTTEACTDYYNSGKVITEEIQSQIFNALAGSHVLINFSNTPKHKRSVYFHKNFPTHPFHKAMIDSIRLVSKPIHMECQKKESKLGGIHNGKMGLYV